MPTTPDVPAASPAGAVLLCRADPDTVAPAARLLRERMELIGAGGEWSALVPAGTPWADGTEPVDRVLTGWAAALAVSAPWPVLALWWDADRSGYSLASGFRRPVSYEWLTNGTPVAQDEAMRTFAARLGLDPVLDMEALERLTRPDAAADARARLRGLLAVLMRAGVTLPDGLAPGLPAGRLCENARALPGARTITWSDGHEDAGTVPEGVRPEVGVETGAAEDVRLEPGAVEDAHAEPAFRAVRAGHLGHRPAPGGHRPPVRALAAVQLAVGLAVGAYGVRCRSGGWIASGALLLTHGVLGLAYDRLRDRG
ncbi:hypothetical protein ACWERY_03335 [Streptomyces sp. NPDC004082]|uniref:hypothetical protein n=1 Tax=unclassified Streptomyces TaxID=2593676 RepID=UPI0033B264F8